MSAHIGTDWPEPSLQQKEKIWHSQSMDENEDSQQNLDLSPLEM